MCHEEIGNAFVDVSCTTALALQELSGVSSAGLFPQRVGDPGSHGNQPVVQLQPLPSDGVLDGVGQVARPKLQVGNGILIALLLPLVY